MTQKTEQKAKVFPPELLLHLVEKFDGYKTTLVEHLKQAPKTETLFQFYNGEIRKMLAAMRKDRVPREIRAEVMRIVNQAFNLVREMANDSGYNPGSSQIIRTVANSGEEHAKVIIESTKALAPVIVPEEEIKILGYKTVSTPEIIAGVQKIPNAELRSAIERNLAEITFPEREDGEDDKTYQEKIEETGYKGGGARFLLKVYVYLVAKGILPQPILADAKADTLLGFVFKPERIEMIEQLLMNEIPMTDKDIVVGMGVDMWKVASALGVDPDGVERLKKFDLVRYMNSRDIDMNQCLLRKHWLSFTPQAFTSVYTGIIHSAGRARTIFGVDEFRYMKLQYFTNKILHRLVKNVVEGKAISFELPTYNKYVPLGIYWLVLIRRMVGKQDQNLKIAKIWDCAVQMGQTQSANPKAFIRELVALYPEFSFRKNQGIEDIARWILGKFTVSAFRHLKVKFGINPPWTYQSKDPTPLIVTPDVSHMAPAQFEAIDREIQKILARALEQQYPSTV